VDRKKVARNETKGGGGNVEREYEGGGRKSEKRGGWVTRSIVEERTGKRVENGG